MSHISLIISISFYVLKRRLSDLAAWKINHFLDFQALCSLMVMIEWVNST